MKKGLWIAFLLALTIESLAFQPVRAIGPELTQTAEGVGTAFGGGGAFPALHCGNTGGGSPFLCSTQFGSNVGSGDVILVGWGGNGQPCRPGDVSAGITDTLGTSYGSAKVSADDAGDLFGAAFYAGVTTSGGTDNVTISVIHTGGKADCSMNLYDISSSYLSSATPLHTATNSISGAASSPYTTSTTNALVSGNFAVAFIFGTGGTGSPGTSFTGTLLHFVPGAGAMIGGQYSDSVASPTNYPVTCSSGGCTGGTGSFVEAAMIMPTALQATTLVQPCNFNELQCWWYPMLFYGVYTGGFMAVAAKGNVGSKGFTFMLLAALTICSLIQVQMGMMNLLMPVGLTLASIVYAVRSG